MEIIHTLLARNRSWVKQQKNRDAHYFLNHISGQQPQALWIGCSDSRVPAEVLTCAKPGELFVHRNIASMVVEEDESLMSVLQYALQHLHITTLILCGHYGCGGVRAALDLNSPGEPLSSDALMKRLQKLNYSLNNYIALTHPEINKAKISIERLMEYHVLAQVNNLSLCRPVKEACQQGRSINIYGCIYELHTGHLTQLIHHERTQ